MERGAPKPGFEARPQACNGSQSEFGQPTVLEVARDMEDTGLQWPRLARWLLRRAAGHWWRQRFLGVCTIGGGGGSPQNGWVSVWSPYKAIQQMFAPQKYQTPLWCSCNFNFEPPKAQFLQGPDSVWPGFWAVFQDSSC